MKLYNLLLVFFLLLVPNQPFENCHPRGVMCDYVSSRDPRKRNDNEVFQKCYKEEEKPDSLHARVHYEIPDGEKTLSSRKIGYEEDYVTNRESKTLRETGANCQAQKPKREEVKKPKEKMTKLDCKKPEMKTFVPVKTKNVFYADCEECDIQVKPNGDGVVLKCKHCREIPPEEIFFPAGNNRRIITLP